jgi:chain length determinant protein (polysaccharide antigen chain regulator)
MEGSTATISKDKAVESFFSLYKINSDKKISGSLNLSAEWHDPDQAAGWVNGLSELANEMVVEQLLSNLDYRLQQQITILESSSSAMRKIAQKRREDRIVVLTEAYKTAIILGLHDFLDTESGVVSTPTYYRGSKALNAEIDILRNRSSDDPFIDELRNLEEMLLKFKSINISDMSVKTYTLDQQALPPKQPIKPKRDLIVTMGGIIGLIGGVFLAFLLNIIQNQKNRSEKG